jgi:hypothetical protein
MNLSKLIYAGMVVLIVLLLLLFNYELFRNDCFSTDFTGAVMLFIALNSVLVTGVGIAISIYTEETRY